MEKPIGAPARGRRAWQPQHLAGPHGRGRSLLRVSANKGRPREREKCGTGQSSPSHHAPGAATHRGLAILYSAGTPDEWTTPQQPLAAATWGARTDPALARRARTRPSMHMVTYTHVRPDTRAAYNSQGRRKETVGQKGEEMK